MIRKIIFTLPFVILGCNKQSSLNQLQSKRIDTFFVTKIDSTENSYFLSCKLVKESKNFVLVSPKVETGNCEEISIGKKYKMDIDFQSIMAGDYGDYIIDGKEFPIETIIAFTNGLKGLCIQ